MKINVAMVNYKNTKPFLFGFNQFVENTPFRLSLLNPAKCSQAFENGNADIALVPAAFLEGRSDYKIITDYCIGANGPVNSVAVLSNQPIDQIETVILDNHSLTSNRLVKILFDHHWKREVDFVKRDVSQGIELPPNHAVVMIGDKVFEQQDHFQYKYDLSEQWKQMTGMPFVFAVWIAKKDISEALVAKLNEYLQYGVDNINTIIENESDPIVDLKEYLTVNLKYKLNSEYRLGLNNFLETYSIQETVH